MLPGLILLMLPVPGFLFRKKPAKVVSTIPLPILSLFYAVLGYLPYALHVVGSKPSKYEKKLHAPTHLCYA